MQFKVGGVYSIWDLADLSSSSIQILGRWTCPGLHGTALGSAAQYEGIAVLIDGYGTFCYPTSESSKRKTDFSNSGKIQPSLNWSILDSYCKSSNVLLCLLADIYIKRCWPGQKFSLLAPRRRRTVNWTSHRTVGRLFVQLPLERRLIPSCRIHGTFYIALPR